VNAPAGSIGAIVLAAGGSTRLGHPKQLVTHDGLPLVVRAARAALAAGADPVVVVLGSGADAVRAALTGLPIVTVDNDAWVEGMGTSVGRGVRELVTLAPAARGVLLTLVDQPLVGDAALRHLIAVWADADALAPDGATIAAAEYANTVGVPAIFGRAHFAALTSLPPASGAAPLIRAAGARLHRVPIPEASVDVDTPEDLARMSAGAF
jgi:molybdenum cofactor cytidylyltransferase